jgi:uroporphyrin-III C-methyltransferase/precorrin-2 dehydrogenase/sirohydrochlorin ferrochelatase
LRRLQLRQRWLFLMPGRAARRRPAELPMNPLDKIPPRGMLEPGQVALIGTGPGDPELLTIRALRLLLQADVVLYDKLVSPEILALIPERADKLYVGKERNRHALRQEAINQRLVELARSGKRVVRLKGGDPFVFGRGGEEIETLSADGVRFQVVPGITAATGVSAYAGIPLTHRDYAQACVFVTGHLKDGSTDLDWIALARPRQTVVIYMGFLGLPEICRQLIAHGLPADTPAAIIQQGTTDAQRSIVSTVENLPAEAVAAEMGPPALIIIGGVVNLHHRLAWYRENAARLIAAQAEP